MKNVIITGANGFVGSELIKRFLQDDIQIIAIDKDFSELHIPQDPRIVKIESTLENPIELQKLIPFNDIQVFYHLAWGGVNGNDKASPIVQIKNIETTINCATFAKNIGCPKFLVAGTVAEQAVKSFNQLETISGGMMYGAAKHCAHILLEAHCKNIDLNYVWMQFSNIYGPNNKTGNLVSYTISQLKKGQEATFGPALQPYNFIYVDDLIEAIYRLGNAKTSKHSYFIGSGEQRILKDYLYEIGRQYGMDNLIQIGVREADGVEYTNEMFDISPLINDIGEYITRTFSDGIKYTIDNF